MKKKSLLLGLTVVIIVASTAVGGTLAYFTSADNAKNTFTVGSVEIDLYEHKVAKTTDENGLATWNYVYDGDTKIEVNENTYDGVYPSAVLPKDPTIRNTGKSPAYVRMKVTISNASAWKSKIKDGTDLSTIFGGYDDMKCTRSSIAEDTSADTITYVYNYTGILGVGHDTGALFTSVTIPTSFDNAEIIAIGGERGQFTMSITAEAIQSEGFNNNSTAAFAELDHSTTTSATPK